MPSHATRPIRAVATCFVLCAGIASSPAAQSVGPLQFVPQAQLSAPGTSAFGGTIALDGDDLAVRANGQQFVFHRQAGTWTLQASFTVPNGTGLGSRETDLAIGDEHLLIGSPASVNGKAWLSERSGTSWSAPIAFVGPIPGDHDQYGHSVLVRDDLLFIGIPDFLPGGVEIRRQTPAGWKVVAGVNPGGPSTYFSLTLRDSASRLLVGDTTAVEVFAQGSTSLQWTFEARLAIPAGSLPQFDRLGSSSIDGDVIAVSSFPTAAGTPAWVYEHNGFAWALAGTLFGADAPASERIAAVAVQGQTIYVGQNEAVYVFQKLGSGWTQTAKLVPSPALPAGSFFGHAIEVEGTTLAVAAHGSTGVVQVFEIVTLAGPATYCTAKLNSQGCLPAISASGISGASNPAPFTIGATNVINHKPGFLVYSTAGPASIPFQGGTLCLAAPLRRTPAQFSGGSVGPDDCSGSYAFDFNAWMDAGLDPALAPGVDVWAQYYSRDPADPFQVGLTNAVAFTIGS